MLPVSDKSHASVPLIEDVVAMFFRAARPASGEVPKEEEMRLALFGTGEPVAQGNALPVQKHLPDTMITQSAKVAEKKKVAKTLRRA